MLALRSPTTWPSLLLALLLSVGGCSDAKKKQSDSDERRDEKSERDEKAEGRRGATETDDRRGGSSPSEKLRGALREGATHAGYANVKLLKDRGWFDLAKLEGSVPGAKEALASFEQVASKCGTDPFGVVEELAWSGDQAGDFVLVAKLGTTADKALACLKGLGVQGEEATIEGRPGLRIGTTEVVVDGDHVVAGTSGWLRDHLAGRKVSRDVAKRLAVAEGDALRVAYDQVEAGRLPIKAADGTLSTSAGAATVTVSVRASDVDAAKDLETRATSLLPEVLADLKKEVPSFSAPTITRDGDLLLLAVTQKGDAVKQMEMVGALSVVGVFAVRRYLQRSKAAEAKNNVGIISRLVVNYVDMETAAGKAPARFPPTAPAVPKDVPAGKRYTPSDADFSHPSWKAIRFSLKDPFYYRYRFETSADGKTCTVIIEGDLDGDGVLSKFTREITIDAQGRARAAATAAVENELE